MNVTANFFTNVAHIPAPTRAAAAEPKKLGVLSRLIAAIQESRARQAQAEIAFHAGMRGLVTDEVERKMGDAMFRSGRPLL